jgi:hypothetical protein
MTINKAKQQMLKSVGIYLPSLFAHGQLYAELSLTPNVTMSLLQLLKASTCGNDRFITLDIVYQEVL